MKVLDLFSGIGGFSLAASWLGWETVQFVEIDKFCQKVLNKHWPSVPIHSDIKTFDGTRFRNTIDIICGGDPCQPSSVAGQRKGKNDHRYLWPENFRIIGEVKPRWVVNENVPGTISNGILDQKISDLESEGYTCWSPFIIPASAVGSPHKRARVWLVAYSNLITNRKNTGPIFETKIEERNLETKWNEINEFSISNNDVANSDGKRLQKFSCGEFSSISSQVKSFERSKFSRTFTASEQWKENWYEVATRLCRVDDGISRRMDRTDRLKALGNAIVPQVAYEIFKAINEFEQSLNNQK